MKFRKIDVVLSEDFEWELLRAAFSFYINEMHIKGIKTYETQAAFDKLVFYSKTFEKVVDSPFLKD